MPRKDWPLLRHPDIADPIRVSPAAAAYYLGRGWEIAPEPPRPTPQISSPPDDPAPTRRRRAAKSSEED